MKRFNAVIIIMAVLVLGAASTTTSFFKNVQVTTNVASGTITSTNGVFHKAVLVANLGTPTAGDFPTKYSSDVVTSKGTGGYVRWDGSNWLTWEDVTATSDVTTFVFNAMKSRLYRATPKSTIFCSAAAASTTQSGIPRVNVNSGTGAASAIADGRSWGVLASYATGTTTNGIAISRGPAETWLTADVFACGGSYSVATASDTTETYNLAVGMGLVNGVGYPTAGAFFLYDPQNTRTHNIAASNNWICVTGLASSYTFADSGLPVTVSSLLKDDLAIIFTGGSAKFYTNGVICATISATVPGNNTVLEMNQTIMQKRNAITGTTSRIAYESRPWTHFRFNVARTY